MSKLIPGNHKHLTLEARLYIEQPLDENKSFRAVSRYLCRDPSTISDEGFRNRIAKTWKKGSFNNPHNFCIHKFRCRKTNAFKKIFYVTSAVARAVSAIKPVMTFNRNVVRISAGRLSYAKAVISQGINPPFQPNMITVLGLPTECTRNTSLLPAKIFPLQRKQLHAIDAVVKPLILQGQSPYMILTNHPELGISVSTLYNYIDKGVLLARNIDLKRKVKFKSHKVHNTQI